MSIRSAQRGLTLVELIVFIVIVGAALAGVLTVFNHTTRHSADPLLRKQALAIAEAILEEVMLQPFTWCDPDDARAATALSATIGPAGCAATAEALGPDTVSGNTDLRGSATHPFDNVNDYDDLVTQLNIGGTGAAQFNATVAIAAQALNGIAATESLLVTVTVVAGAENIQLQGYRTRHSPNLLP